MPKRLAWSGSRGRIDADQRYYASAYGRFNTADQYMASAGPKDPGSWNRYAYVGGDPVNFNDPRGRQSCSVDAEGNVGCDGVEPCDLDPAACIGGPGSDGVGDATWGDTGGDASRYLSGQVNNAALQTSVKAILGTPPCEKDVTAQFGTGGGSIAGLESNIGQAKIFDTTLPGVGSQTLVSALGAAAGANGDAITLSDAVAGAYAVVPYLSANGKVSTDIVLAQDFFNRNILIQQAILTHEMFHIYTGLNDADLAAALGISLSAPDRASEAITNYFESNCTLKKL